METIQNIISTIEEAVSAFQGNVPGTQNKIFKELQPLIKNLEIKDGRLVNSLKNLKAIGNLKNKIERIVISNEYKKSVEKFVSSFSNLTDLNNQYFRAITASFSTKKTGKVIQKLSVDKTINDLLGQGMVASIADPIKNIITEAITTGGNYADFNDKLRDHIVTNDTGDGTLERYTRQITTDALNQYNAQYQDAMAQDLNFNWGRYIGSNLTTTREFCEYLTRQEWVHRSQLQEIIEGKIGNHICKLSKKSGLPLGMIPGTTADNFKIRRGGYNCGHQFFWVPDNAVPANIRSAFTSGQKPESSAPPEPEKLKTVPPMKYPDKPINSIEDAEKLFHDHAEMINRFFTNTKFKSLRITTKSGINGSTDMDGNINLSRDKTRHMLDGFENLRNGTDLSLDQEKAFATLWHEIWHNTNQGNLQYLTKTERQYMELGNEFTARKTLDDFFEVLGSKLKNESLRTDRSDTGYNTWVRNFDRLIAHYKADESGVISFMKDKMKNGDYKLVKNYLREAIIQNSKEKISVSELNSALRDAVGFSEKYFAHKYE